MALADYTLHIVNSKGDLDAMVKEFYSCGVFAFDTETRSKDYEKYREGALRKMDMECDLASFATPSKHAYVVPLGMVTIPCMGTKEFFDSIKEVMEDPAVEKRAWNFSFDGALYANYGVGCCGVEDLMVKAHLLNSLKGASLKSRCADAGISLTPYNFKEYWNARHSYQKKEVDRKGNPKVSEASLIDMERLYVEYSAEDAIATMELDPVYAAELDKSPTLWGYYYNLLMPALITLFQMERTGLPVNQVYLRTIAEQCRQDLEAAEAVIFQNAGMHFNLGSTKELGNLLYKVLGYPTFKTTPGGAPSTDADALGQLAQNGFKLAEDILRWRGLQKLYTGYLDPSAGLYRHIYDDGCIHPSPNIAATETGRLSYCVSADTILKTSKGDCRISELVVDEGSPVTVTTHLNRQRRILEVIKKPRAQMYRVTTADGRSIDCTGQHRFAVVGVAPWDTFWAELRHLEVGSKLASLDGTDPTIASVSSLGEQDVWDIQVEEDHSYVAHGFINHNSAPNTQQTPKSSVNNYNIRMIYVPHRHMRLIGGDLSQAELRIMADRSGDKAMVAEYRKDEARWKATNLGESAKGLPKSDLHQTTADACNATRDDSKGINFGNLYGMYAKKLASVLTTAAFDAYMDGRKASFDPLSDTVQVQTAADFQTRFFSKYSGVKAYQDYIGELVLKNGYSKTRWGRIRYLPDAFASDKWLRLAAQRAGINHCFTGDTIVSTVDGTWSILELVRQGEFQIRPGLSAHAFKSGTLKTVCVRFVDGGTIRCTPDHRLKSLDGSWVEAGRLVKGSLLQSYHEQGQTVIGEQEAYLTGYALANGSYCQTRDTFSVYVPDHSVDTKDFLKGIISGSVYCGDHTTTKGRDMPMHALTVTQKGWCRARPWLNQRHKDMRVPSAIFGASAQERVAFIDGYLTGDGTVSPSGTVSCVSKSVRFIEDLANLVSSLGFSSRWFVDGNGFARLQLGPAAARIGWFHHNQRKRSMYLTRVGHHHVRSKTVFSGDAVVLLTAVKAVRQLTDSERVLKSRGVISTEKAASLFVELGVTPPRQVESVEESSVEDVYDIEVHTDNEDERWFSANGVVAHNCIQGHVAEMVLFCMCRASNAIPNPDGEALKKLRYRLLQQIHDEVQGEGPDREQDVQDICFHLTRIFQNPGVSTDEYPFSGYRVPILFDVKSSYDWHSTH